MPVIELPNGDYIDPRVVREIRVIVGDDLGPRGLIDTVAGNTRIIGFEAAHEAYAWKHAFAAAVNATES